MKKLLIKNKTVLVSDIDFEWASALHWNINKGGYVANSKGLMARLIMREMIGGAIPPRLEIDHKNRNRLDNQRENLRLATKGQNQSNSSRPNKSGFRGVKKKNRGLKWRADIGYNGKKILIGCFETPELAAQAYDKKAVELFGDFATLNFPKV